MKMTGDVDEAAAGRASRARRWARRTIAFTPEQVEWLERQAFSDRISVSALVRRAVDALAVYRERVR
jgi:hypothetical protein